MFDKLKSLYHQVLRLWPLLVIIVAGIFLFTSVNVMVSLNRLAMFALILLAFHVIRKALFPYIDLEQFAKKALEAPVSASVIFAAIIAFMIALCFITVSHAAPGQAHAATDAQILAKAGPYIPTYKQVVRQHWPDAPHQEYFPGKVEQETCVNLAKCWNPRVELKTSREYGCGLSEVTRAYRKDGSIRFDKLEEARHRYAALAGWNWDNRFEPRYHFVFIALEAKRLYASMRPYFTDDINRWAAAMVSYNSGPGTVTDRRAVCSRVKGCDRTLWFGGLDTVMIPGEEKLLYGKPLYQRRNEYPHNIIHIRSAKYIPLWRSA